MADFFSDYKAPKQKESDFFSDYKPEKQAEKEPSFIDGLVSAASNYSDTYKKILSSAATSALKLKGQEARLLKEGYAGLVRGAGGIEKMVASGLETVYDTGRMVGEIGLRAAGKGEDLEPFQKTDYLSGNIQKAMDEMQTGQGALSVNLPKDRTQTEKTVGRIAEYAPATAAVTRALLAKGATYLANPSLLAKDKTISRAFQNTMAQAAKDPKKAMALEQTMSALMATSGQALEELGFSPSVQLVGELATAIASGSVQNTAGAIRKWASARMPASIAEGGKQGAAEYLQSVAKSDPEFSQKIARGEELAQKTGIKLDTAELANSPELKAAKQAVGHLEAGTATATEAQIKAQTQGISDAFPRNAEAPQNAVKVGQIYRENIESELGQRAANAMDNVLDQVDKVAPISRTDAGIQGRQMLETAKAESQANVSKLYEKVGNPVLKTDIIKKSIKEAARSDLKNNEFLGLLDAHTKKIIQSNFNAETGKLSLNAIRDFQSHLGQQMTNAKLAGDAQKERIYAIMYRGVSDQLDNVTKSMSVDIPKSLRPQAGLLPDSAYKDVPEDTASRMLNTQPDDFGVKLPAKPNPKELTFEQIGALKEAKAAAAEHHNIFSQGEVMIATKTGAQGMDKITTEGFINTFIQPNTVSKTARAEEAVDNFYNAYGKTPESKEYLANSFGVILKEKMGQTPNPKAVARVLNQYSRFLERAGIRERFDTVQKAIKQAEQADRTVVFDKEQFAKTALSKFLKADDPVAHVMKAVDNKTIVKLFDDVDKIPNQARRETMKLGLREALWEGIYNKTITTKHIDGVMILDAGSVRQMMAKEGDTIRKALGKEHAQSIDDLMDIIDRVSQDIGKTGGIPDKPNDKLFEQIFTGLRAAAHGFVRPDLILAQISMRGQKAILDKASRAALKEALDNPEFAKELLKLNTTKEGKQVLKALFTPVATATITDKGEEK